MHNPPHPGEIIRAFCVEPLNLTVTEAAEALGVTRKTLSTLLERPLSNSPQDGLETIQFQPFPYPSGGACRDI